MAFSFSNVKTDDGILFSGLYEVQPAIYADARGFFAELYNEREFFAAGLTMKFVQDNISASSRGVLRGLHFQTDHPQGKLVYTLKGRVYDVAVDLRKDSATFGRYYGTVLDGEKGNMLYIPKGFAHGYFVLSDTALFAYKCTDFYAPEGESGIIWNDPTLAINWFSDTAVSDLDPVLSVKDSKLPQFNPQRNYFSSNGVWIGK